MVRVLLYCVGLGGVLAATGLAPFTSVGQEMMQPAPQQVFNDDLTVRSPQPVSAPTDIADYIQVISGGGQ